MTEFEYRALRDRIDSYHAALDILYPGCNGYSADMIASAVGYSGCGTAPTNEERSIVEVYEFVIRPPERYFLYIDEKTNRATTWTGANLGSVTLGRPFRDNFGGKRRSVTMRGINGRTYHGWAFVSSGSYARVKISRKKI